MLQRNKFIAIFVLLIALGAIVWLMIPKPPYEPALWNEPYDAGWRKFQFCKYDIPDSYTMVAYRELNRQAPMDRKMFILFQNKKTDQYFAVLRLNEIEKTDFNKVGFLNKKIILTAKQYLFKFRGLDDFSIQYLLPFFINRDFSNKTPQIEIRNIDVKSKNNIETQHTDILYVEGLFNKIGFYRISNDFFKKYTVPVFRFKNNMKGIVALVKDKKSGDVIFSFGCNNVYRNFDEKGYLDIVESLTFDAEPIPEAWEGKKRTEWEKAHLPKKSISEMSRVDIGFETMFLKSAERAEEISKVVGTWEDCDDKAFAYKRIAELYEKNKNYDRAYTYIRQATDIVEKNHSDLKGRRYSQFYTRLASIYLQKTDYENATVALEKAKSLDKDDPYIVYLQGVMADLKGDVGEAVKQYQKFLTYKMTADDDRDFARKRLLKFGISTK